MKILSIDEQIAGRKRRVRFLETKKRTLKLPLGCRQGDGRGLQQAVGGEGIRDAATDDVVIQQSDIDQRQRLLQPCGDRAIGG